jgi:hypothetical protein
LKLILLFFDQAVILPSSPFEKFSAALTGSPLIDRIR